VSRDTRASVPFKRTRNAGYLQAKRRLADKEQRAFDRQAKRLVTWGRSR